MQYFVLALFFVCALAQAQGVYVTRGEKGTVFSDKPQPGARPVELPPLNIIRLPKEKKDPGEAAPSIGAGHHEKEKPAATAVTYTDFSVVFPENESRIVAGRDNLEIRLSVAPPLRTGEGHAFRIRLNGREVVQRFVSQSCVIPPEFWNEGPPPDNLPVQVEASLVDANGQELMKAAPIRFSFFTADPLFLPGSAGARPSAPLRPPHAGALPRQTPGKPVPQEAPAVDTSIRPVGIPARRQENPGR